MISLINPFDRLQMKEEILRSPPFPHFCIDNFLNTEFADEIYNAFPSFQDAQKMGKEFSSVNEQKKIQITDVSKFPPAIAKLNQLLGSPEFLEMISDLMGIPDLLADPDLIGGGIHETNSGGHLDVHVDFNYLKAKQWHRRLNILIYFNKDWQEDYGGNFEIWDKDVKKCFGSYAPIFNRVFVFATSNISYHGVNPLTCPPEIMRKSFAAYYYTQEAPKNWDGEYHSTIFKSRPDEWLKGNILMPTERSIRFAKRLLGQTKQTVKSILTK
ncbi:2OG-Fe(II) oxygenase [Methyloglobulus sp.]|uniref:2OG-Fe(II) oxygenase n=1 Tax=Methyloglobulus sp. TaxID=2518622 RepID=UPI0032B8107B